MYVSILKYLKYQWCKVNFGAYGFTANLFLSRNNRSDVSHSVLWEDLSMEFTAVAFRGIAKAHDIFRSLFLGVYSDADATTYSEVESA